MHVDRRIASRLSRCHPYKPPQKSPCYFRQSFLHQEGNLKVEPSRSQYLDKDESRNRTREPDHERGCRAPRQPDRPCAKRRGGTVPFRRFLVPRRETTGRDRPFPSSCRSAAERRLLNRREGDAPGKRRGAKIAHIDKKRADRPGSVGMRDLGAAAPPEHRPPARRGRSARGPPDKTKKARPGSPRGGPQRMQGKTPLAGRRRPALPRTTPQYHRR